MNSDQIKAHLYFRKHQFRLLNNGNYHTYSLYKCESCGLLAFKYANEWVPITESDPIEKFYPHGNGRNKLMANIKKHYECLKIDPNAAENIFF